MCINFNFDSVVIYTVLKNSLPVCPIVIPDIIIYSSVRVDYVGNPLGKEYWGMQGEKLGSKVIFSSDTLWSIYKYNYKIIKSERCV